MAGKSVVTSALRPELRGLNGSWGFMIPTPRPAAATSSVLVPTGRQHDCSCRSTRVLGFDDRQAGRSREIRLSRRSAARGQPAGERGAGFRLRSGAASAWAHPPLHAVLIAWGRGDETRTAARP